MGGPLWYVQIFGNILLLFPLSIFVGFILKKNESIWKIILIGILTSIGIEIIQLGINIATQFPNKVMDIDDLILNTCGIIIGAMVYKCLQNIHRVYSWVNNHVIRC
jgi:glycopeptide antibiotics resistance protein